ncbi:MAG TPA: PqqD family protein [Pyrinomonadaceae bacterium]|nr:PqqD family protein [Pyrinomonadaceae bacterium]
MKSAAALPRARKDGLVSKELHGETLVYDLERDEAHCLNQTAALVWKRCDGKTTVAKMAALLQQQLGASVDVDIVWLAIKQLERFHLIENGEETRIVVPSVSRRALVLKYAPAALALPVIMSISAPAAAQAATPTPTPTPDPCATPPFPLGCPCGNDSDCASFNCNAGTCGPALKPNPGG